MESFSYFLGRAAMIHHIRGMLALLLQTEWFNSIVSRVLNERKSLLPISDLLLTILFFHYCYLPLFHSLENLSSTFPYLSPCSASSLFL